MRAFQTPRGALYGWMTLGLTRPGGARRRATQELERDPTVMVMGEDVGHYGGSYKARAASQPHARLLASLLTASPTR